MTDLNIVNYQVVTLLNCNPDLSSTADARGSD